MDKLNEEPVLVGGIIASIMSFLAMAVALGWIELGGEQMKSIQVFLSAFLPLLVVVSTMLGALWGRQRAVSIKKLERNSIEPSNLL